MHASRLRFLVLLVFAGAPGLLGEEPPRRMSEALRGLIQEDAKTAPRDPRIEDLTPEERDAIVPAREVDEPPDPPEMPEKTPPPVLMEPMIVEGRRDPAFRRQLHEHDRAYAAEERATQISTLDEILNHPVLSILGGANAEARAAQARYRMRIMDVERMLLLAIAMTNDPAEKAELKAYLADLREMRR